MAKKRSKNIKEGEEEESRRSDSGSDLDSELESASDDGHSDNSGLSSEVDTEDISGGEVDGDEEEGSDAGSDKGKDEEMEELEKQYQHLRSEQQNILSSLKRHKDEDAIKGQAVKNQKALWDRNLEFRFLLQKAFSSSNRLPQEPIRSLFCNADPEIENAYLDLTVSTTETLNSMLELQEALLEKNPAITQSINGNGEATSNNQKHPEDMGEHSDDEWMRIQNLHSRLVFFRDTSIDKWQRKTQVTSGATAFKGKLNAFNQSISDQVAGYMRDPSRMIKRMQLTKSATGVFGEVQDEPQVISNEDGGVDVDPDLIDDSEFYQQLLKEFFESCDPTSSETAFYAMKRMQTKKRKIVDRRASKSRKIRYNVHEKIVNFMAPVQMNLPPMAPNLFENLFGLGNQKQTSAM